jgi:hypothetical protein
MADDLFTSEENDQSEASTGGNTSEAVPPKERTKKVLAIIFMGSSIFAIAFLPLILVASHIVSVDECKDLVLTLAGVLGGPLGIIINNYFKDGDE